MRAGERVSAHSQRGDAQHAMPLRRRAARFRATVLFAASAFVTAGSSLLRIDAVIDVTMLILDAFSIDSFSFTLLFAIDVTIRHDVDVCC